MSDASSDGQDEVVRLIKELEHATAERDRVSAERDRLSAERDRFQASNESLAAECAQLKAANVKLQEENDELLQQTREHEQRQSDPEEQDERPEQTEGRAPAASVVPFSVLFKEGPLGATFASFRHSTLVHSVVDGGQASRHHVEFGDRVVGIVAVGTAKVTKFGDRVVDDVINILRETPRPYEIQFERGCFSEVALREFSLRHDARASQGNVSGEEELGGGQDEEQEEDEHEKAEVGGAGAHLRCVAPSGRSLLSW